GADPVAPSICVVASKVHAFDVLFAEVAARRNHARLDVHAIFCTGFFKKPGRSLVAEPARAEVHANPDPVLLVGEKIDVVIAGADSAELLASHFFQRRYGTGLPRIALEQRMVDAFVVAAADPEADRAPDVVHDALNVFAQPFARHVNTDGLVAAGDVV